MKKIKTDGEGRLKRIARLKSGESITANNIDENNEYPVYGGNGLRGYTNSYTHNGDYVLIGRQGALCGCINYACSCFWASEHAIVVAPIIDFVVKWLGELLHIMNLNQYSQSAAQPGLSVENISSLYIPVPSFEIQQTIAVFLNRETVKIDFLIDKIEASVFVLLEYRIALISVYGIIVAA